MKKFEVASEVVKAQEMIEKKLEAIASKMDEINAKMENLDVEEGDDIEDSFKVFDKMSKIIGEFEHEVQECYDIVKARNDSGAEDLRTELNQLELYLAMLSGFKEGFRQS